MRVKVILVAFPENCNRRLLVHPFASKAFHNCLFMITVLFIQSHSGKSGCIEGKSPFLLLVSNFIHSRSGEYVCIEDKSLFLLVSNFTIRIITTLWILLCRPRLHCGYFYAIPGSPS
jgi:succinate dehydrogenase hydrophobic anchor subunit